MRRLVLLTFVTLDGVMQAPSVPDEDRSGGFDRGGWAAPYWEGVMAQVQREAMVSPYDILFGRKTYELFAGHWTQVEGDPTADRMNAARKYVVSTTRPDLPWRNSHLITGDVPREIAALKQQEGPLLQVHGSAGLIRTLLAYGLVDELRLWIFPVIVGSGKRLFEAGTPPATLELVKTKPGGNGVIMAIYGRR